MGVQISELLVKKEIEVKDLSGKIIAIDAFIFLYQFLTGIRGRDGSPLTNSKGEVTSHIMGLFNRTSKLMQQGLKLAYVFDGEPPKLKEKERERRRALKVEAQKKFDDAKKREDVEEMRKYGSRTARLTPEMVADAKDLIKALGLPVVEAPAEGEAQASLLVKQEKAFAVASQDADAFLFGAPRVIRNLSISGRKKRHNSLAYDVVKPELVDLTENVNELGIDQSQLIALAMLVGTDFNIGGIKGIGPKNAIKLVKKHKNDLDTLFAEVKWDDFFDYPWTEVFYLIKKMPVDENVELTWSSIDRDAVLDILVGKLEFSEERVISQLDKLTKNQQAKQQKGLGDFF